MLRAIVLLLLVAVGFVAYSNYQTANTSPVKPTVPSSPTAAASFDQKVATAVSTVASGSKKPVHLVLTESEITSKIEEAMSSGSGPTLQNVQVKLGSDVATIYGTTSLGGLSVPVEVATRLGAANGKLSVDVISVKAENMDLPSALVSELTQRVKQAAGVSDLHSIDVGIDVSSVRVQPGQLQIDGTTR